MLNMNDIKLKDLKEIAKELKIKGVATMNKDAVMSELAEMMEDEKVAMTVEKLIARIETPRVKGSVKSSLGLRQITFNGKTQSISAWAKEIGISRAALYDRINRHGWTVEEALKIPMSGHRKTAKKHHLV